MTLKVEFKDPQSGVQTWSGLLAERPATGGAAGSQFYVTDQPGRVDEWDGAAWNTVRSGGAGHVLPGTSGGSASVTTLANFVIVGGASQTGTSIAMPSGRCVFQANMDGTSGAFSGTVTVEGSLDDTNFETLGTMTLSGTAGTPDSDGFAIDAPWAFVRASVAGMSGTGSAILVYMSR